MPVTDLRMRWSPRRVEFVRTYRDRTPRVQRPLPVPEATDATPSPIEGIPGTQLDVVERAPALRGDPSSDPGAGA